MQTKQYFKRAVFGGIVAALYVVLTFAVSTIQIPVQAAELLPAKIESGAGSITDFKIHIVHTNDIHARVEEDARNGVIGVEKLKTVIDQYKQDCDLCLVLDSGDLFHGLPIATVSGGESIALLAKELGIDAMTVGNHDWNYGQERLKELLTESGITMLTGNVEGENGTPFFGENDYLIKTVEKNGKTFKMGIFGVIDPEIYNLTAPDLLKGITYTDAKVYANKAAKSLREQGCDYVICLTHTLKPAEFAAKVNGVDLFLAGHEHMLIDTVMDTPDGGKSRVIEDGMHLQNFGCYEIVAKPSENAFDCTIQETKYDYESTKEITKDAGMTKVLDQVKAEQAETLSQKVGYSPDDLDGVWEHLRTCETNLGRAVTSAYLKESGAQIAFENAGGIRASMKKGDITYGDVIAVFPYGNYLVTKRMSGADILSLLEENIRLELENIAADESGDYDAWPPNSGNYLQVGGMRVNYNPSLTKGKRILSAYVGNTPINKTVYYTVAVNSYIAESTDLPQIRNAKKLNEYRACDEVLSSYFTQEASAILTDIGTERMIRTNEIPPESTLNKKSMQLKAGKTGLLSVQNGTVKNWSSSNKKVATVSSKGKVTALKKGTATITATLTDGQKLTCKVTVKTSPSLKIGGKAYKKKTIYQIKAGKTLTVTITGKAASVNNQYSTTSKKTAKVVSKKTATKVKIKGLKKGKATITLKVNGVSYKVKVKVVR